jgi:hypothetical protein
VPAEDIRVRDRIVSGKFSKSRRGGWSWYAGDAQSPDPLARMHTMTKRQGKSCTIDVKALLRADEEFLRALVGKIISPLGLALIVGGTNIIRPEASVNAMIPAMFFLAFWAALAAAAFVALGIETKGRSIEEIDAALAKPASLLERAPAA